MDIQIGDITGYSTFILNRIYEKECKVQNENWQHSQSKSFHSGDVHTTTFHSDEIHSHTASFHSGDVHTTTFHSDEIHIHTTSLHSPTESATMYSHSRMDYQSFCI